MSRKHYRLHFLLFDGKTPLWWVTRMRCAAFYPFERSTGGFSNSGDAIRAAAKL